MLSLLYLISAQLAKCQEYDEIRDSIYTPADERLTHDVHETTLKTGRLVKFEDIKVMSFDKTRLAEMDSHKWYLRNWETHPLVDEDTSYRLQSMLECPWITAEMKAACVSSVI